MTSRAYENGDDLIWATFREARVKWEDGKIDGERVGVQARITRGVSRVGWNRGGEAFFIILNI